MGDLEIIASTNATIRDFIKLGDAKAGAILTFVTIVAGAVGGVLATLIRELQSLHWLAWVGIGLVAISFAVSVTMAAMKALRALAPNTTPQCSSLCSFVDIANLAPEEYVKKVTTFAGRDTNTEMATYNWTLGTIAKAKFEAINRAIHWLKVAVASAIVLELGYVIVTTFKK